MDQRNLILAIALSAMILIGFQLFWVAPQQDLMEEQQQAEQALQPGGVAGIELGQDDSAAGPVRDRATVVGETARVAIATGRLSGSINMVGGRIDDVVLNEFREDIPLDSPQVKLLSPAGSADPYFAEFGWVDAAGTTYGSGDSQWTAPLGAELTPQNPVVLSWDNGAGLQFTRTFAIDDDFMFTVLQQVENFSNESVSLFPFGRVTRINTPEISGFFILHEGPIGVLDGTLREVDYDNLQDDGTIDYDSVGGWIGFTDKYWLTALVPDPEAAVKAEFNYRLVNGVDLYQADYLGVEFQIAPGATVSVVNRVFAGAKKFEVLDAYRKDLGIERFQMAIDFGWFFFLTQPLLRLLVLFGDVLGNFGLAILSLTVLVKLAFFPLASKSYKSMSRMKALQPQMTELREKYGEDRQRMQQELMALYKREKANPVSGCLPMVIQIPVFFALYKVLFVSIEMRQAPFYGWIKDLSVTDPTNLFNLFGLLPFDTPSFLHLGAWPLIMGISMFMQQKLNPAPADPIQARMFMLMPFFFTFLLASFPAGLVIYWAWNNTLSMAQQYLIMRRMGVAVSGGKTTTTT